MPVTSGSKGIHLYAPLDGKQTSDEVSEVAQRMLRDAGARLSAEQGVSLAALARLEARVAFEEVLRRWPDWTVDYENASRARTSSVRGWARLPVRTR